MKYKKSDLILRYEDRIPAYYVSLNGQIKFYTLAGMLLESAAKHASLLGYGYPEMMKEKVYWVLSRFHTVVHSYPLMDEIVIIETWPKKVDRLFFLRDYRMLSSDGRILAEATSAWLILDGNTGRPKKFEDKFNPHELFVADLHGIEAVPEKLAVIPEADKQQTIKAMYSDLDINNHVNAVKYIEWIQDFYTEEIYKSQNIEEFQINYQLETRFGEEVNVRMKNRQNEDPFDYFEGIRIVDQNPAFRARIKFGKFE
ncbi:acyl-[acyl-carrier-protein] thioesterase [Bacteroidota bacterium]